MENIAAIIDQEAKKAERRNKRKAKEISQCDSELAELAERTRVVREKRRRLYSEQQQSDLVKSLKTKGAEAWSKLSNERKWQKANVLAVLCCEKASPRELQERQWTTGAIPRYILEDRDILLARLARKDFPLDSLWWPVVFRLPPQFHGDKQVALATLKVYPRLLEQDVLTEALLDDPDICLAYVYSEKLSEHHFGLLSKFSERILGNAGLMLQAAKQLSAIVVLDRFSETLAGNLNFARRLVLTLEFQDQSTPPDDRVLGRFNESIRSRKEIVLSLVRTNGRCLQDADPSLKRDLEVVCTACENNASALIFAASSAQRRLGKDKVFIMDIFSRWPMDEPGDKRLYGRLSKKLKLDRNVIIAALKDGNLSFTDLPAELMGDPDFWLGIIKRDSCMWRGLPKDYENDPTFARAIACFCDNELVAEVFARFPFLAEKRDVWLAITSSPVDMRGVIGNHAPEQIRGDKEVMAFACEKDVLVIAMLNVELQTDRAILEAAVHGSGYDALRSIPHTTQCLYPDLVVQALESLDDDDDEPLMGSRVTVLADSLWSNMAVVRAWFKNGGHVHSRFPDALKNDPEFGLALASALGKSINDSDDSDQYEEIMWSIHSFQRSTSVELHKDKEFMSHAVERCGCLFLEANGDLRRDVDLAIIAYSSDQDIIGYQFDLEGVAIDISDYNDDIEFLKTVRRTALSKINDHQGFLEGFLPGMSSFTGSECHLSMLSKGPETTVAFKKLIAEYVGFPTGESLAQHRKAAANLAVSKLPDPLHNCNCEYCHTI